MLRQATAELWSYRDLLDLAIKQHESLRAEHRNNLGGTRPFSHRIAVNRRDYMYKETALTCPECLVLLQWEQMWEEKKTG